MNHLRELPFLLVDEQGSRLGRCAVEDFPPSVDGYGQVGSGTADDIAEIVAVHHQKIQSRKTSGSEQLCRASVQHDAEAVVDHIQAGGDDDAQRGGIFRIVQLIFSRIGICMKIVAGYCHTGLIHPEGHGKLVF